jgi:hypothetical protein
LYVPVWYRAAGQWPPRTLCGPRHPARDGSVPPLLKGSHEAGYQGLDAPSEEVCGHTTDDQHAGVIAHKGPPALRWHAVAWRSIAISGHVLTDSMRRDLQAEFEPQFVGNAPLAPGEIVACHLPDEPLQLHRDWWASRVRCTAPEQLTPSASPSLECLRLHGN